jgi:hypothetical protein
MAVGLSLLLTEMSSRNISWGVKRRPVRRAGDLTTFICRVSRNLGATSWNPYSLSRPVQGYAVPCYRCTCKIGIINIISLMKRQIVLTHAIRETEILALPASWVTKTPSVKELCSQKFLLLVYS